MDLVGAVGRSRVLPAPARRRELRELLGIEQREVASEIGVSVQTVWAWEKGRAVPRGRNRVAYAQLLAKMEVAVGGGSDDEAET